MKISILHPSWKRPELALQCYEEWIAKAENPDNIEYLLCLSEKDPKLYEYASKFGRRQNLKTEILPDNGLVKQVNHIARLATGDLLIAVSDDFGCEQNWDTALRALLIGKSDFILKTDDGLQPEIITLPIMDKVYYQRFGHIYHPEYNHMYADEELEVVGRLLGRLIKCDLSFPHRHYTTGLLPKDETNIQNDSFFASDRVVFEKRKKKNFDITMLSIIIPTIEKRKHMLREIVSELSSQIKGRAIEIIVVQGEEWTIGYKRNRGLSLAKGKYVCYVDDDDRVSHKYIDLVYEGIMQDVDCCSLVGIITTNGTQEKTFVHSIAHNKYFEEDGIYYRPPNHLNVIRASIAKQFEFQEINFGEDQDWAMRICNSGLLKKEHQIDDILYYYDFILNKK